MKEPYGRCRGHQSETSDERKRRMARERQRKHREKKREQQQANQTANAATAAVSFAERNAGSTVPSAGARRTGANHSMVLGVPTNLSRRDDRPSAIAAVQVGAFGSDGARGASTRDDALNNKLAVSQEPFTGTHENPLNVNVFDPLSHLPRSEISKGTNGRRVYTGSSHSHQVGMAAVPEYARREQDTLVNTDKLPSSAVLSSLSTSAPVQVASVRPHSAERKRVCDSRIGHVLQQRPAASLVHQEQPHVATALAQQQQHHAGLVQQHQHTDLAQQQHTLLENVSFTGGTQADLFPPHSNRNLLHIENTNSQSRAQSAVVRELPLRQSSGAITFPHQAMESSRPSQPMTTQQLYTAGRVDVAEHLSFNRSLDLQASQQIVSRPIARKEDYRYGQRFADSLNFVPVRPGTEHLLSGARHHNIAHTRNDQVHGEAQPEGSVQARPAARGRGRTHVPTQVPTQVHSQVFAQPGSVQNGHLEYSSFNLTPSQVTAPNADVTYRHRNLLAQTQSSKVISVPMPTLYASRSADVTSAPSQSVPVHIDSEPNEAAETDVVNERITAGREASRDERGVQMYGMPGARACDAKSCRSDGPMRLGSGSGALATPASKTPAGRAPLLASRPSPSSTRVEPAEDRKRRLARERQRKRRKKLKLEKEDKEVLSTSVPTLCKDRVMMTERSSGAGPCNSPFPVEVDHTSPTALDAHHSPALKTRPAPSFHTSSVTVAPAPSMASTDPLTQAEMDVHQQQTQSQSSRPRPQFIPQSEAQFQRQTSTELQVQPETQSHPPAEGRSRAEPQVQQAPASSEEVPLNESAEERKRRLARLRQRRRRDKLREQARVRDSEEPAVELPKWDTVYPSEFAAKSAIDSAVAAFKAQLGNTASREERAFIVLHSVHNIVKDEQVPREGMQQILTALLR